MRKTEQAGSTGLVASAVGLWILVGFLGAAFGARSPLVAVEAALVFLPAGLWMLLPVPRDSFDAVGGWIVCGAYWITIVALQWVSVRRRSSVIACLPYLIVLLSFGGCFFGDQKKVFVVHG